MSLIPTVPARLGSSSMFQEDSEWPPSPYSTHEHVFSSRSWRWEERSFVLEGGVAVATIADMMLTYNRFQGKITRLEVYNSDLLTYSGIQIRPSHVFTF